MRTVFSLFLAMAATISGLAQGKPRSIVLPEETTEWIEAPGVEIVRNNCLACHSADYIATQPPRMGQTFWAAEVQKMIKAYKAPIEPADAEAIAKYLGENY